MSELLPQVQFRFATGLDETMLGSGGTNRMILGTELSLAGPFPHE